MSETQPTPGQVIGAPIEAEITATMLPFSNEVRRADGQHFAWSASIFAADHKAGNRPFLSISLDSRNEAGYRRDTARAALVCEALNARLSPPAGSPPSPKTEHVAGDAVSGAVEIEEGLRLAEVGEYLKDAHASAYGNGYDEPRELTICWDWQQSRPDEYGEGVLLAQAVAWHESLREDGIETEAFKLRGHVEAQAAEIADLKARNKALEEGLRPFAAMAKVLEARSRFSGGVASDSQIVADSVGEAGFGVLVMGHFRDAATLIPDAPAWSGLYRRSPLIQPRTLTEADQ